MYTKQEQEVVPSKEYPTISKSWSREVRHSILDSYPLHIQQTVKWNKSISLVPGELVQKELFDAGT